MFGAEDKGFIERASNLNIVQDATYTLPVNCPWLSHEILHSR